ncbi:MAG: cytochrome b N-terminal domain-containing protein [Candidatus Wallbacteria bacterium]|nr:cytochrome b N-terminal domain-containing protein [Candidatus Wallbacteria bacterium]
MSTFLANLLDVPRSLYDSIVRHGPPTSDRTKSQTVVSNFFLHVLPAHIHVDSLKFWATCGLGIVTGVLFGLLCVTGILLMVYYKPSVAEAYDSVKDIVFVVPTGRFMRNIHRWAAHAMVAFVILHMARVFYTSAYKAPRQFNWLIGMVLFVLTLGMSFTGYLLPWDQLAYWAITIGANIAQSPRELTDALGVTSWLDVGGMQKELLLGAHYVGQEALIRFYVLHVMVLPLATCIVLGAHMWRVRKDGGLARPEKPVPAVPPPVSVKELPASTRSWGLMAVVKGQSPHVGAEMEDTVPAYPGALYAIAALSMLTVAASLVLGYLFDAPLKELAAPTVPENPAKAPWYFLGLQELVSYSAFMGGVGIPGIVVLGLGLIPYLDREREDAGVWFSGRRGRTVAVASALFAVAWTVLQLWFTVRFGWLRNWYPEIPQLAITILNPGTVIVAVFALWSIATVQLTRSTRLGAIALFTCFLVSFAILTYFATVHRGPNWDFYWWPSMWPRH